MFNSILEAIKYYAEKTPDALCLAEESKKVSYAEYWELIRRLALVFKRKGIEKGERVILEGNQDINYLAVGHAVNLIGAVFVPSSHGCGLERFVTLAENFGARFVVANERVEIGEVYSLTYDDVTNAAKAYMYSNLEEIERGLVLPEANALAEILFSTGTTGKEKGIMLSHHSDVAAGENVANGAGVFCGNIEMVPSPMNHAHGLCSYYSNMIRGTAVVLIPSVLDIKLFFMLMDKYKVNSLDLVPAALSVILKLSKDRLKEYGGQLRYMEFGTAPMSALDREKLCALLPETPLYNFYGSTESRRVIVNNFNVKDFKKGCIGRPSCNATVIIVDDDGNWINATKDNPGRLAISGGMNTLGYWNDEEETARMLRDGFVYTNDEAYFDEDGDIILLGRRGDVINVGGRKVSPEEIENAAKRLPEVEDCGCVGVPHPMLGSEPKLFVQLKKGVELDVSAIEKKLEAILEGYKVPRLIEQIEKIPRTFNGKILRRELKETICKLE